MPDNNHPLRTLREVQLVFIFYQTLIWRQRAWDHTEVLTNYLIEHEWFVPDGCPFSGFYRCPGHPPHIAVQTLICATHRSLVQSLMVSSTTVTLQTIDDIHRQRCSEEPSSWSLTPPSAPARREKPAVTQKAKKTPVATTSVMNDFKKRVEQAIKDLGSMSV